MKIGNDLKAIHSLSVKDIRRNHWFWGGVVFSLLVCLTMILANAGNLSEKNRWMTYAVFLSIAGFFLPLGAYPRYSDQHKKIIRTVIHTKTRHIALYHTLFGIYQAIMLTLAYLVLFAVLSAMGATGRFDWCMAASVPCTLLILNGFCMLCMNVIPRYALALAAYMIGYAGLLTTGSVKAGLLFPISFEEYSRTYFLGKLVELALMILLNSIVMLSLYPDTRGKFAKSRPEKD